MGDSASGSRTESIPALPPKQSPTGMEVFSTSSDDDDEDNGGIHPLLVKILEAAQHPFFGPPLLYTATHSISPSPPSLLFLYSLHFHISHFPSYPASLPFPHLPFSSPL